MFTYLHGLGFIYVVGLAMFLPNVQATELIHVG